MKLETLKDVRWIQKNVDDTVIAIDIQDLREKAIKWIKAFREGKITNSSKMRLRNTELVIVDWIKHFFNITEGDLK